MNPASKDDGFTLVELLIVMALTGLITTVLVSALLTSFRILFGISDTSTAVGTQDASVANAQLDFNTNLPSFVRTLTGDIQNSGVPAITLAPATAPCAIPSSPAQLADVHILLSLQYDDNSTPVTTHKVWYAYSRDANHHKAEITRYDCVSPASVAGRVVLPGLSATQMPTTPAPSADGTYHVLLYGVTDRSYTVDARPRVTQSQAYTPPVAGASLSALVVKDEDTDGKIDHVYATFGGAVPPSACASTSAWSVSSSSGNGDAVAGVAVVGSSVAVTIGGLVNPDTSNDDITVSFDPTAVAGCSLSGFDAVQPSDAAPPVLLAVTDTNASGGTDGKLEHGDSLSLTFSEAMDPASIPTSVNITETNPSGNNPDTLAIVDSNVTHLNVTASALPIGSGYESNNKSTTFTGTVTTDDPNVPKTIVVTVGFCVVTTDCSSPKAGSGSFVFQPATTLLDLDSLPATVSGPAPAPAGTFKVF